MTEFEPDVDVAALQSYLSTELGEPVVGIEPLGDGLNLVLAVSTEVADRDYVLRRANAPRHTICVNDVEREYEVVRRLEDTTVRAPEPVLFCADDSLVGGPFLVATHLDGETVPLGSALPERFQRPAARERVADLLVETLAGVHSVDPAPFEDACVRLTPREQVDRAVALLDDATSVTGRAVPRLRSVADWLRANAPDAPTTTLVHGDFRPGNLLFAGTDRPEVTGVLDWETATLGDPLTDLGYLLLRWRDEGDAPPSLGGLEARYPDNEALDDLRHRNEWGLAPFTGQPGSRSRRELVARYEALTGIEYAHDRFYRALAAFVLATVWEDLDRHRIESGGDSDGAPYVDYMGLLAAQIVDGEL